MKTKSLLSTLSIVLITSVGITSVHAQSQSIAYYGGNGGGGGGGGGAYSLQEPGFAAGGDGGWGGTQNGPNPAGGNGGNGGGAGNRGFGGGGGGGGYSNGTGGGWAPASGSDSGPAGSPDATGTATAGNSSPSSGGRGGDGQNGSNQLDKISNQANIVDVILYGGNGGHAGAGGWGFGTSAKGGNGGNGGDGGDVSLLLTAMEITCETIDMRSGENGNSEDNAFHSEGGIGGTGGSGGLASLYIEHSLSTPTINFKQQGGPLSASINTLNVSSISTTLNLDATTSGVNIGTVTLGGGNTFTVTSTNNGTGTFGTLNVAGTGGTLKLPNGFTFSAFQAASGSSLCIDISAATAGSTSLIVNGSVDISHATLQLNSDALSSLQPGESFTLIQSTALTAPATMPLAVQTNQGQWFMLSQDGNNLKATLLEDINITSQPQGGIGVKQSVTLSVTATGTITGYQWYKNGTTISGATDVTYTTSDPGEYYVVVKGPTGDVTSETATITVPAPPSPSFTVNITADEGLILLPSPGVHAVTVGGSFTFYITLAEGYEGRTPTVLVNEEPVNIQLRPNGYEWIYTIPMVYDDTSIRATFNTTGHDNPDVPRLYSRDGQLFIETTRPFTLTIFYINGQTITTRRLTEGHTAIPLTAGVYIVRLDGRTRKVVVR